MIVVDREWLEEKRKDVNGGLLSATVHWKNGRQLCILPF